MPRQRIMFPGHATLNNPNDAHPKHVRPVTALASHMQTFQERYATVLSHFQNIPHGAGGNAGFHHIQAGQPFTGWSGIIPYVRTREGVVLTPALAGRVKKFFGRG